MYTALRSRKLLSLASLVGMGLCLLAPSLASAGPIVLLIDDYTASPLAVHLLGGIQNSSIQLTQEGIGILGAADVHFEYVTSDPNRPAPGQSLTFNFNIYEDAAHTLLSDTWNVVITGHTPAFPGDSNVSLDSHFRSDSLDEVPPPALANGVAIAEQQFLLPPSGSPDISYQYVGPPLSDLITGFNSAGPVVPEPATCSLFGIGTLVLACYARRHRRKVIVNSQD
jgi:hypothetical protein